MYIDTILPLARESYGPREKPPDAGTEQGPLGVARRSLVKLLEFSRCFNASQILMRIENTTLFEERILCFTRLQRFEEALNVIYLNQKSYNKAVAYCSKFQGDADTNLFLVLLKVYLQRLRGSELPPAVERLLNDFPQHLVPHQVIPLLPPSISVASMTHYLERSLRHHEVSAQR